MQVLEIIVKHVIMITLVLLKVSSCYKGDFPAERPLILEFHLTFNPGLL